MTDSTPPSSTVSKMKKIPQINAKSTEDDQIRVSDVQSNNNGDDEEDDDDDEEEVSPIAASMLELNNIRTQSVPTNLQMPSLSASPSNSDVAAAGGGGNGEKRENANSVSNGAANQKKKFIVPYNPLSFAELHCS
ncbi:hypothetical protein RND81_11G169000 [Saponaria officinalis]|uniref:Uncharacterized protein n=1 Tax=Saponaria officinalis TaxID=3572 RepID=A0AAW1HNK6_SAPOF